MQHGLLKSESTTKLVLNIGLAEILHFQSYLINTYLHIFPKLLQEHFLVLPVNVDLLSIIDEVIVLVGGQLLGLPISIGD